MRLLWVCALLTLSLAAGCDCGSRENPACGDVALECDGASTCGVTCFADACNGMAVQCGVGACDASCEGDPAPDVLCGAACSCTTC